MVNSSDARAGILDGQCWLALCSVRTEYCIRPKQRYVDPTVGCRAAGHYHRSCASLQFLFAVERAGQRTSVQERARAMCMRTSRACALGPGSVASSTSNATAARGGNQGARHPGRPAAARAGTQWVRQSLAWFPDRASPSCRSNCLQRSSLSAGPFRRGITLSRPCRQPGVCKITATRMAGAKKAKHRYSYRYWAPQSAGGRGFVLGSYIRSGPYREFPPRRTTGIIPLYPLLPTLPSHRRLGCGCTVVFVVGIEWRELDD